MTEVSLTREEVIDKYGSATPRDDRLSVEEKLAIARRTPEEIEEIAHDKILQDLKSFGSFMSRDDYKRIDYRIEEDEVSWNLSPSRYQLATVDANKEIKLYSTNRRWEAGYKVADLMSSLSGLLCDKKVKVEWIEDRYGEFEENLRLADNFRNDLDDSEVKEARRKLRTNESFEKKFSKDKVAIELEAIREFQDIKAYLKETLRIKKGLENKVGSSRQ